MIGFRDSLSGLITNIIIFFGIPALIVLYILSLFAYKLEHAISLAEIIFYMIGIFIGGLCLYNFYCLINWWQGGNYEI
jgi:hypothetical protein